MNHEIINLNQYRDNQEYIVNGNNVLDVNDKKFYNVNKNSTSEIAGAFLEEGVVADLRKRINISDLYPESKIEKDNWKYNEHSENEKEATVNVFDLGKKGFNLVIWISPDDGGKVYKEGRLNIEFPIFGQNEWSIYGKHIPLAYDQVESFKLAQRLLENGGVVIEEIKDIEDVRRQPIGFKINEIGNWIKECEELMPEFVDIWNFIESGEDVRNKIKMEKDVMIAMEEANGDNYLFETIMKKMGNGINTEGGHGSSWGSSSRSGSETGIIVSVDSNGQISYSSGKTEGLTFCDKCGCYHSSNKCPLCK